MHATTKVLGIPSQILENWVRQVAKGKLAGAGKRGTNGNDAPEVRACKGEDGARYSKKATEYFARESERSTPELSDTKAGRLSDNAKYSMSVPAVTLVISDEELRMVR